MSWMVGHGIALLLDGRSSGISGGVWVLRLRNGLVINALMDKSTEKEDGIVKLSKPIRLCTIRSQLKHESQAWSICK
jgi:hypothetical protein